MKLLFVLTAAAVVATTLASNGQDLNYYLNGNSNLLSTGETRSFSSNGVEVTASAWSYTGGKNNSSFEAGRLGQYSGGLGVTNRNEDGSAPGHRVDNFGSNDYILFTFDSLVNVTSIKIASIVDDSDVSYWVGNIDANSLHGVTYSGLSSLGFQDEVVDAVNADINSRTVSIDSPAGGINAIIFGAQRGLDSGQYLDQFKIKSIHGAVVVPEPSTALLSLLGVVGICFRRRR